MKQNIKNYGFILISLLCFTFLTSLILTIIQKNNLISYNTSIIIANSISYILIAIFSFVLGLKIKKHGMIHGLIFSLLVISMTLMIGNNFNDLTIIIKVITKSLLIIFFTILGVNKRNL